MSEPVWYYARGDAERGPFTTVQIKALANAQKVKREDLVWKEGMENWTPAKDIAELFPAINVTANLPTEPDGNGLKVTAEPKPIPKISSDTATQSFAQPINAELAVLLVLIARVLVTVGAMVLVTTSGCESLGQRRVTRLQALDQLSDTVAGGRTSQRFDEKTIRASAEFAEGAFTRGLFLQFGVALIFIGAIALTWLGEPSHRWLGVGVLVAVVFGALSG